MVAICHKPWRTVCEFKDNVEYENRTLCESFYDRKWKPSPNKASQVLEHPSSWSSKGKTPKHFTSEWTLWLSAEQRLGDWTPLPDKTLPVLTSTPGPCNYIYLLLIFKSHAVHFHNIFFLPLLHARMWIKTKIFSAYPVWLIQCCYGQQSCWAPGELRTIDFSSSLPWEEHGETMLVSNKPLLTKILPFHFLFLIWAEIGHY